MFDQLPTSWKNVLPCEWFASPSYQQLVEHLASGKTKPVYPARENIFKALELVSPHQSRVGILGQDPYHNPHQAHGLAFSVPNGIKAPPSLKNIFKELAQDIGCQREKTDLTDWAEQGILLLNSSLTVEENNPGCDLKIWENFTDLILQSINERQLGVVFILWGAYAIKKRALIDESKHHVLQSVHPSPLSAHRGFFGSKVFSKTNALVKGKPINWCGS